MPRRDHVCASRDRRADEVDERGVRQHVAHVTRDAVDEVELAAVRLVLCRSTHVDDWKISDAREYRSLRRNQDSIGSNPKAH
jgi:hypothetical protein